MLLLSQKIPVKLPFLAPFPKLCELLPHKEKLFARMPHHKSIACLQVGILIRSDPRHLIEHRTFQMHHFVVGQYQNIVLAVRITHGKSHLVMMVLPKIRIQFHIFGKIMHPAHIPF